VRTGTSDLDGDRELKIGIAIDRTSAVVGVPFSFQITYENANPKLITNKVTNPNKVLVPSEQKEAINKRTRIEMTYDGSIDAMLTPDTKGLHHVRYTYRFLSLPCSSFY